VRSKLYGRCDGVVAAVVVLVVDVVTVVAAAIDDTWTVQTKDRFLMKTKN
jgi:hypothetical protein